MDKKRILCIEDSFDFFELIKIVLSNYEVVWAPSNESARREASEKRFNLYLLDHYLSDGTSDAFVKNVREFDPVTPILFVTGAEELSEKKALKIGARGIIRKADKEFLDHLVTRVNDLLEA